MTLISRDLYSGNGVAIEYGAVALEFVDRLSALKSKTDVLKAMQTALRDVGFEHFVMTDLPQSNEGLQTHLLMIDLPIGWPKHYLANDYHRTDPVVRMCRATTNPFEWSEAPFLPREQTRSREVMQRADDFGMKHGFTLPIHGLDGLTSCLSMSSGEQPFLNRYTKPALHLMGIYALERVRELEERRRTPTPVLTPREIEVLTWAAAGKSAATIADILMITERTVVSHTVNATQKLGAANKTEAVARALLSRLISL